MNDSDRNILRSLRHEPCEAHCTECNACDPDPICEDCGEPSAPPEQIESDPIALRAEVRALGLRVAR